MDLFVTSLSLSLVILSALECHTHYLIKSTGNLSMVNSCGCLNNRGLPKLIIVSLVYLYQEVLFQNKYLYNAGFEINFVP